MIRDKLFIVLFAIFALIFIWGYAEKEPIKDESPKQNTVLPVEEKEQIDIPKEEEKQEEKEEEEEQVPIDYNTEDEVLPEGYN